MVGTPWSTNTMMLTKYKVLYETNTHKFGDMKDWDFNFRVIVMWNSSASVREANGFATEIAIENQQSSWSRTIFGRNPFVTMTCHCLIVNAIPFFEPLSIRYETQCQKISELRKCRVDLLRLVLVRYTKVYFILFIIRSSLQRRKQMHRNRYKVYVRYTWVVLVKSLS